MSLLSSKILPISIIITLLAILIRTPSIDNYSEDGRILLDKAFFEKSPHPFIIRFFNYMFTKDIANLNIQSVCENAQHRLNKKYGEYEFHDYSPNNNLDPKDCFNSYNNTYWKTNLDALLFDMKTSDLSAFGAILMKETIVHTLVNMVDIVMFVKNHPKVLEEKISKPIVILGPPRTSTTYLHNILSNHPDLQYIDSVDVQYPIMRRYSYCSFNNHNINNHNISNIRLVNGEINITPFIDKNTDIDPSKWFDDYIDKNITKKENNKCCAADYIDTRNLETKFNLKFLIYFLPLFPTMFNQDINNPQISPQEDIFLQQMVFNGLMFESQTNLPNYSKLIHTRSGINSYKFLKLTQQALQYQRHSQNKRWLMKTPGHAAFLRELLEVYPDAKLIITHRDPIRIMESYISMLLYFYSFWNNNYSLDKVIEYEMGIVDLNLYEMMKYIDQILNIRHVGFGNFSLEEIARYTELRWNCNTENKLLSYIENNPRKGANKLKYDIASMGITEEYIKTRFDKYIKRMGYLF